ncbi:TPA: dihydroorotate oxidase [Candidatus Woesearchaeota archaeon]|nr:dihydroorotate oxidase [Candidatus Woesearchaeota archaeon]HIH42402.1 dihydroorotate oxidase [Candidatus Woesearchaeota archaeon]
MNEIKNKFKTSIAGFQLHNYLFNASGPRCMTLEELIALGESRSSVILSKSCTLLPREGNPEPRYFDLPLGSINSMGLPNLGYKKYVEFAPLLRRYNKPYFVSVSGLSLADNITMISELSEVPEIDAFELNLSCPNVIGKPQIGYDFEQTKQVLDEVMKITKKPFGVKLPPYFDFVHFEEMAKILNKHNIAFVTCINSIGNGLFVDADTEKAVIKPKGGFGGLGGEYVKPTALANVKKFYELLRKDIAIIGVGGIASGMDAFEFLLCGASAVQIATAYQKEGTAVFARIEKEFIEFLEKKEYNSLSEAKGKLKIYE